MRYETVIGLEVHVELATDSKIFCSCANRSGDEQNSHVCPACCGMPGMLPVTNKHAVDLGMTAGMMLNCHINRTTTFDKKSYYYPDLPCSYQTTQWFSPVAVNGTVRIETESGSKDIRIKQIHMEEDAGKLVHDSLSNTTLVDFNRTSVPLIEIVSQPDLSSADEVVAYLERLRSLLRFAKVSECRMELGTMRCDVNLSVRPEGTTELGVRTEMKNMNSISAIRRAIAYEVDRHIDAIEHGTEELVQETRRWDDEKGMSFAMRNKETAGDYRYFPDPNVMPIVIDDEWYDRIKDSLPPFPEVKKQQLVEQGLTDYDADLLVTSRVLCDCYDAAFAVSGLAKECANWIATNCLAVLKKNGQTMDDLAISGTRLGELVKLVGDGVVSNANAKKILEVMFKEAAAEGADPAAFDPKAYAEANDMVVSNDTDAVMGVICGIVAANEKDATDFRNGNEKAINPLFGKCMKELKGNCEPKQLRAMLIDCIMNA